MDQFSLLTYDNSKDQNTFSLNETIKARVARLIIEQKQNRNVYNDDSYYSLADHTLNKNDFSTRIKKAYLQFFRDEKRPLPSIDHFKHRPKTFRQILNLMLVVFLQDKKISALDRLIALKEAREIISNREKIDNLEFIPTDTNTGLFVKLTGQSVQVEDFEGIKLLEMKKEKAHLCHSIEPFLLLKEQINKLEDGLWDNLRKSINRLFAADSFEAFFSEALVLTGMVEKHLATELIPSENPYEDFLGGHPANKTYDNLLYRYRLDCHCHSQVDDWKERVIPQLINQIFLMKAV